ncbi:MAG: hypothetical protein K8R79_00105 [Calditrichales bacterium]|nr:hypothetical protein [Calditrichales bacterium]
MKFSFFCQKSSTRHRKKVWTGGTPNVNKNDGVKGEAAGKKHDKKLAGEQEIPFPEGSKLWQDTGF